MSHDVNMVWRYGLMDITLYEGIEGANQCTVQECEVLIINIF